jgi:predicted  nucleic acid-binding Zn-ribbon protein
MMLNKLLSIGKQIAGMLARLERHDKEIAEIQLELKAVKESVSALSHSVEMIAMRMEHLEKDQARAHENLILRLHHTLQEFSTRLPPGKSSGSEIT